MPRLYVINMRVDGRTIIKVVDEDTLNWVRSSEFMVARAICVDALIYDGQVLKFLSATEFLEGCKNLDLNIVGELVLTRG